MHSPEARSEEKVPRWAGEEDLQFKGSNIIDAGTRDSKQLSALSIRADTLRQSIKERDKRINELEDLLRSSNERADELERIIAEMQQCLLWQLLSGYQSSFVEKVLPHGTGRREKYDFALEVGRVLLNNGWGSFCRSVTNPRSMRSYFDSEYSRKETSSLEERNGQAECNFKNYDGKKFILLKNAEIRADKDAVKTELENILKRLNGEI